MAGWIQILLAASLGVLVVWVLGLRRRCVELTNAIIERRPLLLEGRSKGRVAGSLDELQRVVGELIREARARGSRERDEVARLAAVFGGMREAVLMVAAGNRVLSANVAAERLFGGQGRLVGRSLESLTALSAFFEYIERLRTGSAGEEVLLDFELGRERRSLVLSGSRLPGDSADVPLLLLFLRDVTQRRELERMRRDFVANASHELRTPVSVIKGFTETLLDDRESLSAEERVRFLEKIRSNSERLHRMLEEMLMLSELESNPEVLKREPVLLDELVQTVTENTRMRLEPGQKLDLELMGEAVSVLVDPLLISQVIENLLENALRHAIGFTRILVKTEVVEGGIRCAVADDGKGIPEVELPHVFERFYRVDKGRSRRSGGSGLGLSIVKHIVQQHGGEVHAKSGQGEGAEIAFWIPFQPPGSEKGRMKQTSTQAVPASPDHGN